MVSFDTTDYYEGEVTVKITRTEDGETIVNMKMKGCAPKGMKYIFR